MIHLQDKIKFSFPNSKIHNVIHLIIKQDAEIPIAKSL